MPFLFTRAGVHQDGVMRRTNDKGLILNPAVGFELRDGFAAVYNQCGQLTPGQGAAAGVVGGLSGNVAALR
jgi:hypothetical protein